MYGLVGSWIAAAGHVGAPRRVPGATETTIFVDPAAPGSPQTTMFVDPAPPGASKPLDLSIQRFRTSPSGLQELREVSGKAPERVPMPSKTSPDPLRDHWDQLLQYSRRLRTPAGSQCLQIRPLFPTPSRSMSSSILSSLERSASNFD